MESKVGWQAGAPGQWPALAVLSGAGLSSEAPARAGAGLGRGRQPRVWGGARVLGGRRGGGPGTADFRGESSALSRWGTSPAAAAGGGLGQGHP